MRNKGKRLKVHEAQSFCVLKDRLHIEYESPYGKKLVGYTGEIQQIYKDLIQDWVWINLRITAHTTVPIRLSWIKEWRRIF